LTLILTLAHNGPITPIFISLKYLWHNKYYTFVILNFQTIGAKFIEFKMIFVSRNPTIKLNIVSYFFESFVFIFYFFHVKIFHLLKHPHHNLSILESPWWRWLDIKSKCLFVWFVCMWPCHNLLEALVENPSFLTKTFSTRCDLQLCCNSKFLFKIWIMVITNEIYS